MKRAVDPAAERVRYMLTMEKFSVSRLAFHIERDALSTINPAYEVEYRKGSESITESYPWTPALEELFLLEHPKRTMSLDQEKERFGNVLSNNLKNGEDLWGRTTVRWGLAFYLRRDGRFNFKDYAESLQPSTMETDLSGERERACLAYLKDAIQGVLNTLIWVLKYSDAEALRVVSDSLPLAIENRYRLGLRKSLFPHWTKR